MKLVCSRDALAEALAVAGSVVVSRTPAPVLLCLKLEAKDGPMKAGLGSGGPHHEQENKLNPNPRELKMEAIHKRGS